MSLLWGFNWTATSFILVTLLLRLVRMEEDIAIEATRSFTVSRRNDSVEEEDQKLLIFSKTRHRTDPRHKCRMSRLRECFDKALLAAAGLTVAFNERRSALGQSRRQRDLNGASCQSFEQFQVCFTVENCEEDTAATVAAEAYFEMYHLALSKETFLAINGYLRQKCFFGCSKDVERNCQDRMGPESQDRDHALLLELNGQRLQLEFGMIPSSTGCDSFKSTLVRWAHFRVNHCEPEGVFCYCLEQQKKLERMCNLNCPLLKPYAGFIKAATSTPQKISLCFVSISILVSLTLSFRL